MEWVTSIDESYWLFLTAWQRATLAWGTWSSVKSEACACQPECGNTSRQPLPRILTIHAPQVEWCEAVMSDGYLVTPVWGPRGGCLMAPCLLLSPSPPANGLEEDNTKGTSSSPQDSSGPARRLRTWAHTRQITTKVLEDLLWYMGRDNL